METITEHWVNYTWKGGQRSMLVKRRITEFEKFYHIRTAKGETILQWFDYYWHIVGGVQLHGDILTTIGKAIDKSGIVPVFDPFKK